MRRARSGSQVERGALCAMRRGVREEGVVALETGAVVSIKEGEVA